MLGQAELHHAQQRSVCLSVTLKLTGSTQRDEKWAAVKNKGLQMQYLLTIKPTQAIFHASVGNLL